MDCHQTQYVHCIDTVETWFKIDNGQIIKFLLIYLPARHLYFTFRTITSKSQWIFTKFDMCIDIVEIFLGIAHRNISSIF